LAASTESSLLLKINDDTVFKAASATAAAFWTSAAFFDAIDKPCNSAFNRIDIASPAASSLAKLILDPVDNFSIAELTPLTALAAA
jgi:hypothetical protein